MKAAYGIFKQSPAKRADFLSDNDIADQHDDQTLKSFFPLEFCGHKWLENGKAFTRFMEISEKNSKLSYIVEGEKNLSTER